MLGRRGELGGNLLGVGYNLRQKHYKREWREKEPKEGRVAASSQVGTVIWLIKTIKREYMCTRELYSFALNIIQRGVCQGFCRMTCTWTCLAAIEGMRNGRLALPALAEWAHLSPDKCEALRWGFSHF